MRGLFNNDDSLICLSDVKAERVHWLWEERIPQSMVTILAGDMGMCKTWITCALTAAVSRGRRLAECKTLSKPANVLLYSAEDSIPITLKPRLVGCNANCKRVFTYPFGARDDLNFSPFGMTDFKQQIVKLRAKLVVIDPLLAYTSGMDSYRPNDVRAIMSPLMSIADECSCAIVCTHHLNKGKHAKAIYRLIASGQFPAAARSVLLVGKNPRDPIQYGIAHIKCNVSALAPTLGYVIVDGQLEFTGESDLTADDLLAAESKTKRPKDIAHDLLIEVLDGGKPMRQKRLFKKAKDAGISESTLRRVAKDLGVKKKRKGGLAGAGYWVWRLPGG